MRKNVPTWAVVVSVVVFWLVGVAQGYRVANRLCTQKMMEMLEDNVHAMGYRIK